MSLAQAAPITLYDWAFNVNGMTYEAALGDTLPGNFNDDNFNWDSGIGTLFVTFSPSSAGDYKILGFFDHEIVEGTNTFFNEYAFTTTSPQTGQTWEADESGFLGDIYYNLLDSQLDNTNGVPKGFPDDVAMAMGWDFHLASDEYAIISFILDETEPESGFYLTHADQASSDAIFFSSSLTTITTNPVPEPGTLILFGIGLIAISKFSVSNKKRKYL
ncbi:MAG: PEP-CTERM sorting domain-containing protein [Desulfobacula sp.]|nr:PEP-CTERM sorting domain-containing protein [Desulfobacula sp.]